MVVNFLFKKEGHRKEMMKYRVKEKKISPNYSEYKIQQKHCFFWFEVVVDCRYLTSLAEAQRWIKLKKRGIPVDTFYYEH